MPVLFLSLTRPLRMAHSVENNIICGNGSALHVPWREEAATELQAPQDQWGGKVHFLNNQVLDSVGPSLRIETCERNPFVGVVCGNVLQGNAEQRPLAKKLQDALDSCVCTRSATGNEHSYQPWFECKTCRLGELARAQRLVRDACLQLTAAVQMLSMWRRAFAPAACERATRTMRHSSAGSSQRASAIAAAWPEQRSATTWRAAQFMSSSSFRSAPAARPSRWL